MAVHNPLYTQQLMDKYGVAWYKFDGTDATKVTDYKSSYSATTVTGTTITTGTSGNARSFNGTSDYIDFGNQVIPLGKKSIRFRIKKSSMQSKVENILGNSNASAEHGTNIFFSASNMLYFQSTKAVSGTPRFAIGCDFTSYANNQWHDVLVTWDGTTTSGAVKIFIDDMITPKVTGTADSVETTQAGRNFRLARGWNTTAGSEGFLSAELDEIEIYNEVITPLVNKILILSNDGEVKSLEEGGYNTNLIPKMTSATAPSGVVERSGDIGVSPNYGWNAFDGVVTVPSSNGWHVSGTTGWISYQFSSNTLVNAYSIKAVGDSSGHNRVPKNWTFEGWNGTAWVVLDTRTNIIGWAVSVGEKRYFSFSNNIEYIKYRVNVTANNGDASYVAIGELEMMTVKLPIIKTVPNSQESTFINRGMDSLALINPKADYTKKQYIQSTNATLGSGKTFTQPIDLERYKVNKITFQ